VEKKINQTYMKEAMKLQKVFGDLEDEVAREMATEMRKRTEKFRENLWMVELLTTEAMCNLKKATNHWREIFTKAEVENIEINEEMNLKTLLEKGLDKFREIIEDVSRKAEKQWAIEKKLKEIEDKVKDVKLDLFAFKNTGTYVLKSVDEVQ